MSNVVRAYFTFLGNNPISITVIFMLELVGAAIIEYIMHKTAQSPFKLKHLVQALLAFVLLFFVSSYAYFMTTPQPMINSDSSTASSEPSTSVPTINNDTDSAPDASLAAGDSQVLSNSDGIPDYYDGLEYSKIEQIQYVLYSLGYMYSYTAGIVEMCTVEAVRAYQRDRSLVQDGIAGPITQTYIQADYDALMATSVVSNDGSEGVDSSLSEDSTDVYLQSKSEDPSDYTFQVGKEPQPLENEVIDTGLSEDATLMIEKQILPSDVWGDSYVTRYDFYVAYAKLLRCYPEALNCSVPCTYSDVADWMQPVVSQLEILGYLDGSLYLFPNDFICGDYAVQLNLRALGYWHSLEDSWQVGCSLGLMNNTNFGSCDYLTWNGLAALMKNVLFTPRGNDGVMFGLAMGYM